MAAIDVPVFKAIGCFRGLCERTLGFAVERQVHSSRDTRLRKSTRDLFANCLDGQAAAQFGILAQDSEQHVLGFNANATVVARFVASEEDRAARFFGVAFEQGITSPSHLSTFA